MSSTVLFCFCAVGRWHPKLHHLLVEMEKGHLKDIDLPHSLRKSYSIQEVIQVRNACAAVGGMGGGREVVLGSFMEVARCDG